MSSKKRNKKKHDHFVLQYGKLALKMSPAFLATAVAAYSWKSGDTSTSQESLNSISAGGTTLQISGNDNVVMLPSEEEPKGTPEHDAEKAPQRPAELPLRDPIMEIGTQAPAFGSEHDRAVPHGDLEILEVISAEVMKDPGFRGEVRELVTVTRSYASDGTLTVSESHEITVLVEKASASGPSNREQRVIDIIRSIAVEGDPEIRAQVAGTRDAIRESQATASVSSSEAMLWDCDSMTLVLTGSETFEKSEFASSLLALLPPLEPPSPSELVQELIDLR